jgi:hypothetical protein
MNLGRSGAVRCLVLAVIAVISVGVLGCGVSDETPSADATTGSTPRPPFALHQKSSARLVNQAVHRMPGLRGKVTRCPGAHSCKPTRGAVWKVSAQRHGRPIKNGSGFDTSGYVAIAAFPNAKRARAFVTNVGWHHSQFYDGTIDLPMTPGRGDHYTPGQSGIGVMTDDIRLANWRGWRLSMRRSYEFWDHSSSEDAHSQRTLLRRGRFVLGVYLDARSPGELRRLARFVRPILREVGDRGA